MTKDMEKDINEHNSGILTLVVVIALTALVFWIISIVGVFKFVIASVGMGAIIFLVWAGANIEKINEMLAADTDSKSSGYEEEGPGWIIKK